MKTVTREEVMEEQRYKNYVLLSRLLANHLTLEDMRKCLEFIGAGNDSDDELLDEASSEFAAVVRHWLDLGEEQALKVEYSHVLVLPAGVKPYESVYLADRPLLHQEPWIEVKKFYVESGFKLEEPRMLPEDHLSVEYAFMAHLIESGGQEEREKQFFNDHIAKWASKFWEDMRDNQYSVFYKDVASYGLKFTEQEMNYFSLTGE